MRRRSPILCAVLSALALCGLPAGAHADAPVTEAATQIIVRREAGLTATERADMRADAAVSYVQSVPGFADVEVVSAQPGDRADAIADLRADPDVVWAAPNAVVRADTTDAGWGQLWALSNTGQSIFGEAGASDADIDAPEAWAVTKGAGVTVAVADSGVRADQPDLAGALVAGRDFVDGDSTPQDGHGHGTHVTGTIVARENTIGVVGVAPQAQAMPVRVLDANGAGTDVQVAAGLNWAAAQGARVVNASLGGTDPLPLTRTAIATHPNTLFVVAAGNDGVDDDVSPHYPCSYPLDNVLCVGATDNTDHEAAFSNHGATSVDIDAPGVDILSTCPGLGDCPYDYAYMSGTSMATPHVSGVAALLLARDPSLTTAQLKQAILSGGDVVPALAGRTVSGRRLNAAGALGADVTVAAPASGDAGGQSGQAAQPAPATEGTGSVTWTAPVAVVAPAPASVPAAAKAALPPALRLGGLTVVSGRRLVVVLNVAGKVRLSLSKRTCRKARCTWGRPATRTVSLKAGRNTLTIGRTLAGISVPTGTLRVTATVNGRSRSVAFKVARRTA